MKVKFNDLNRLHEEIRDQIDDAIKRVIDNNAYVLGKEVETFEENFANYNLMYGKENAAGVSTGMDALELILRAKDIGYGDEVITQTNTFNATASAIVNTGAKPVLVDIDEYYMADIEEIEKKINKKTKAIMPVHLYGQMAKMSNLVGLIDLDGLNISIIEDACQAHGANQYGEPPGGAGDAAAFSFYPGKNLGAFGDGGIVVSKDTKLIEKIKKFRNYGQTKKYHHDECGRNNRLDGLQAAILDVKLNKLNEWNASRNKSAKKYIESLENINEIKLPKTISGNYHVYHLFVIEAEKRDELISHLEKNEIETGIHYPIPIHLQKAFENLGYKKGDFSNAERGAERIVSLPIFPYMRDDEIEYVCENIREFYKKHWSNGN